MGRTLLIQDSRFRDHRTGAGHPERPERLEAIERGLASAGLAGRCAGLSPSPVDMGLVASLHDPAYIERLRQKCANGAPFIDVPDSAICPESYDIARLAAGATIGAVDAVLDGLDGSPVANAFCAVRPPGHHAEHAVSMGFCLFNNVALAAKYLLDERGFERVLIVDFDVHHGNGTQHLFEAEPRVMFVSIHGHPQFVYPGTGYAEERGIGDAVGMTLNVPVLPNADDDDYRRAFDEQIIPAADGFAPQFVLLSAGFDAHRLDPLAPIMLETASFGWITDSLLAIAKTHAGGRTVSLLEGGYHLDALADSAALHLERLLAASASFD